MKPVFFITGTDTGAGKTVLTVLLTRFLCECGIPAAALKPVCSGNRDDARALRAAAEGAWSLDQINPWHFRAPIAPLLAARREHKRVRLADVLAHIRRIQKRPRVLLIEGAGGLLSPLGEHFNSRDLVVALGARPIVVCPNRLGAVNQVLLTIEALPKKFRSRARVVLISPVKPDASTGTNAELLAESFDAKRIFRLPWWGGKSAATRALQRPAVRQTLRALIGMG